MKVKIDTRPKFHVITILEPVFAANMTAEIEKVITASIQNAVKNVVLNLSNVSSIETAAAEWLVNIQQQFYEQQYSFVCCALPASLEKQLDEGGQLEVLNATPTESEAADIVHMEEIERELLGDDPQT